MSSDKEHFNELIRWFIPINYFTPEHQDEVVRMADILTFRKKEYIFRQGEKDDASYYLLKGEIDMLDGSRVDNTITSGTERARYPVAQLQPHHFSARAKTEVTILKLDRLALDRLMVIDAGRISDTQNGGHVREIRDMAEDAGDWMTSMLQSPLFCRLPTENIYQLFTLLKHVDVMAGDTVIRQDEVGDYYYIIREGRCEVSRTTSSGSKPIKLTELQSGDSFGDEALLTNAKHNVSVTMLTDGVLMKLSKENFINLVEKPAIEAVSYYDAGKFVAAGAYWLDVRFPDEHKASHIKGSINIPLHVLRTETGALQTDRRYVVYCDTGVRSSAAAFLLAKRGYNACYLENGLAAMPGSGVPAGDAVSGAVPGEDGGRVNKEAGPGDPQGAGQSLPETGKIPGTRARTSRKQDAEALRKRKQEADRRLEKEKIKFQEIYEQNAREMEKLRQLKKQAEEQLDRDREELREQFEKSRQALEQEAEKKRADQEAMEKAMQNKIKAMLEQERRKLAEEIVRANQERDQSLREEAIADVARKAVSQEAKVIIKELKKEFELERRAEQARLVEERLQMERESRKIQEALDEIQKTREKAEALWGAAEADAEKLREKQQRLEAEMKSAETRLAQARKNAEEVQQAENSIAAAREAGDLELLKLKEEELRRQLEAEITAWKEEHADDLAVPESIMLELRRMKEHAEVAKKTAEKRARDLISEIASQIWKR